MAQKKSTCKEPAEQNLDPQHPYSNEDLLQNLSVSLSGLKKNYCEFKVEICTKFSYANLQLKSALRISYGKRRQEDCHV